MDYVAGRGCTDGTSQTSCWIQPIHFDVGASEMKIHFDRSCEPALLGLMRLPLELPKDETSYPTHVSLAGEGCGLLYLTSVANKAGLARPQDISRAEGLLSYLVDLIAERPLATGLFDGLPGIGLTISDMAAVFAEPLEPNALDEVDDAILAQLQEPKGAQEFDLTFGLSGILIYASLRASVPSSLPTSPLLLQAYRQLLDVATDTGSLLFWKTRSDHSHRYPETLLQPGNANLGLAHGNPGVLLALAHIAPLLPGVPVKDVARSLWSWIKAQRGADGHFPYIAGGPPGRMLGWCYGSLSVSVAAARSALLMQDAEMLSDAEEIALSAAAGYTPVRELGLCHGALGVACCFHSVAKATGNELLMSEAEKWTKTAISTYVGAHGVINDKSLLTGSLGMSLCAAYLLGYSERWTIAFGLI